MNLQQLALDHLLGQADQQVEHAQVLLFQRHLEGLHVKPVAGQHAFLVAPGGVGRRAAAAHVRAVDNVVVDQRRRVHHLHHRAQADGALARVAQHVRGEQQQRRADALAAALAQVFGNLRDGADAGGGVAAQLLLDRHEVVPQQIEDLSRRRYRQCAQSSPVPVLLSYSAAATACSRRQKARPAAGWLNSCGSW